MIMRCGRQGWSPRRPNLICHNPSVTAIVSRVRVLLAHQGMSLPDALAPADVRLPVWVFGCAKTPAVAPHVEISPGNCITESRMILHTRGSMPCWRIVFSTFCGMKEFLHRVGQTRTSSLGAARPLPPSADIGPGGQSVGQAAQFCLAAPTPAAGAVPARRGRRAAARLERHRATSRSRSCGAGRPG